MSGRQRLADQRHGLADALLVSAAPDIARAPPLVGFLRGLRLGGTAPLHQGDHSSEQEREPDRRQRGVERAALGVLDRRGDRRLRRERGQADVGALEQRGGDEAIVLPVLLGRPLVARR